MKKRGGLRSNPNLRIPAPIEVPFVGMDPNSPARLGAEAAAALREQEAEVLSEEVAAPSVAKTAAPVKPPGRKKSGARVASATRTRTLTSPYLRRRDQAEIVQISAQLPKALRKQAKMHCLNNDVSMSQVIERALESYLAQA